MPSTYDKKDFEINLKEIFAIFWQGKWVIIFMIIITASLSIWYAKSLPNIYRAQALLAPTQMNDTGSSMPSQLGGLASLAGVSLGGSGGDKTPLAIEYMKSRAFLKSFLEKRESVLPNLFAAKGWASSTNTVVYNTDIYDKSKNDWLREVDAPKLPKPSVQEAHVAFSEMVSIKRNDENGFVVITVEHYSPFVAAQWATWLIEDINQFMQGKDVKRAENSIEYLSTQLDKTNINELRERLFDLVQSQTEKIMLANATPEYVFTILDPAIPPEMKFGPKRSIIVVFSVLFGALLAASFVFLRHLFRT